MQHNGTLSYETITGASIDEYGEVTVGSSAWSDPLPCLIKTNNDTRLGEYEDGEWRKASFTVHLELEERLYFDRVKLTRHGEELGEYRVQNIEALTTVGRIMIVV